MIDRAWLFMPCAQNPTGQKGCIRAVAEKYPPSKPASGSKTASGPAHRPQNRRTIAVALEHIPNNPGAPRVIAKGHGAIAEQILQIAFDRGVKVRQDADLAEILAAVDLDSEIPLEALAAVAEILSYVYRAQNRSNLEHQSNLEQQP